MRWCKRCLFANATVRDGNMKKVLYSVSLIVLLGTAYLLGAWSNERSGASTPRTTPTALPGNDRLRSTHVAHDPHLAGACPVERITMPDDVAAMPEGAASRVVRSCIRVSPQMQQLIGVRVARVDKVGGAYPLRVLGRVVADETRLYRIRSATDGWIKDVLPVTTNGIVKKNELLATFHPPEFRSAARAYLYSLSASDRAAPSRNEPVTPGETTIYVDSYRDSLRNLGMSEYQLDQILRTRKAPESVEIRSPVAGVVLARNLSPGQAFEKGTELYRIADLSRIWIIAETYEGEANAFEPGEFVRVTVPDLHRSYRARISDVPPSFDPATRTHQVRLEADNPGYLLRPGMFADVELRVEFAPTIVVPIDAIVDSGSRKTVYVTRREGVFEAREVETGRRLGDNAEILSGVTVGEQIVASGTFLIDSESRMNSAAASYGDRSKPLKLDQRDEGTSKDMQMGRIDHLHSHAPSTGGAVPNR